MLPEIISSGRTRRGEQQGGFFTMSLVASNVCLAVGATPLVELGKLSDNPKVRIFAKLEGSNPGGSVKDRPAQYMIRCAEESGELTPGKTILEATSGNTGIALAMIGACKGYKVRLVMPECVSRERRAVLEAFGAELTLSPGCEATDGAIRLAHRILAENPGKYYMPNQFANENNSMAHYVSTGPEIWEQTGGEVDVFVAGLGTTGTVMGTGRYLKEKKPSVKVIAAEPTEGHAIQGLKNMREAIVPAIYHPEELDEVITVEDEDAFETARSLAADQGLFVGMSSGAAVWAALEAARSLDEGTIVVVLPDRGDRYLSTTLFRSVCGNCPP